MKQKENLKEVKGLNNETIDKEEIGDCLFHCKELIIDSAKGEIKGHPFDLIKKYGFRPFILSLDKYLRLDKVKKIYRE